MLTRQPNVLAPVSRSQNSLSAWWVYLEEDCPLLDDSTRRRLQLAWRDKRWYTPDEKLPTSPPELLEGNWALGIFVASTLGAGVISPVATWLNTWLSCGAIFAFGAGCFAYLCGCALSLLVPIVYQNVQRRRRTPVIANLIQAEIAQAKSTGSVSPA